MRRTLRLEAGFTLIELLVASGVLGIILVMLMQNLGSTAQVSSLIANQTALQGDLRSAGAIITDEVQRAYHVFAPGTVFNLAGPNAEWRTGPRGSTTWTVGASTDAPILAMITAPRRPDRECTTGPAGPTRSENIDEPGGANAGGCYEFVAYYPVPRRQVSRASASDTTPDRLERLPDNDNQWVIVEYRRRLNVAVPPPNVNTAGVRWDDVGCQRLGCVPPQPDPEDASNTSVPASFAEGSVSQLYIYSLYQARLAATVANLINADQAKADVSILVDNIQPTTGFSLEYPDEFVDDRGVTRVLLKMQAGVVRGTQSILVPREPIEFFSSPRNIPPES